MSRPKTRKEEVIPERLTKEGFKTSRKYKQNTQTSLLLVDFL